MQELNYALITYHDTPIGDNLPTPAELFFECRINTQLGLIYDPSKLDDHQKSQLAEKRAVPLNPAKDKEYFFPKESIWFTEDGCSEWKPGYIHCEDTHPNSYWIIK